MGLIEKHQILNKISPPLDALLASQLLDEFISMEHRYIQRDWGPAELDGGQFCEALARILYHIDSGNLNLTKGFDDALNYVEGNSGGIVHNIQPRSDALHLTKVLRTIYKFRNQRGVAHISPSYSPNQMDSKLVIESVRWALNETLRIFWTGNREEVAKTIRELLQFDVPVIGKFEDVLIVQRTDLSSDNEVLLLLHYAGEVGFSRKEIGLYAMISPASVTNALQKLASPKFRQIVQLANGNYRLTDLGAKHVRENLANKLLLE